jgi:long-subunit acyl-CoA synthetase (AMP-forming)
MNDVRCPLNEAAHISTNEAALIGAHGTLLFSEFEQCVQATAVLLKRHGCERGSRVAVLLPSDWQYVVVWMAVLRLGAVVCPVDPDFSAEQIEKACDAAACEWFITNDATREDLPEFGPRILRVEDLVGYTAKFSAKHVARLAMKPVAAIHFSRDGAAGPVARAFSVGNFYYGARGANAGIHVGSGDVWLIDIPFHQTAAVDAMFRSMTCGAAIALRGPGQSLVDAVKEHKATCVSTHAAGLEVLLDSGDASGYAALKRVIVHDGPLGPQQAERARAHAYTVISGYRTEACAAPVTSVSTANAKRKGSAGKPLTYREVRVSGEGEISVRSETLFLGYVEAGRIRPPEVDNDGWYATGDTGRIDADECLYVTDCE